MLNTTRRQAEGKHFIVILLYRTYDVVLEYVIGLRIPEKHPAIDNRGTPDGIKFYFVIIIIIGGDDVAIY